MEEIRGRNGHSRQWLIFGKGRRGKGCGVGT